jgi:hypothetical protein
VRGLRRWTLICAVAGLTACAASHVFVAPGYIRPQRVAVLPMANDTNDLDGPGAVRQALFTLLASHGYVLIPLKEIDEKLKEQGFTDGGQLKAATPKELGEWLGVDGLFYSTLVDFNYILLGFYTQRSVTVHARMVNALTGDKLWEDEKGFATRLVATKQKEAEQSLAAQMAVKFAEKLTHIPLQFETQIAVNKLLATLP